MQIKLDEGAGLDVRRLSARVVSAFQYLRGVMDAIVEQADVESAVRRLGELLDESVVVEKAEIFKAKQFDVLDEGLPETYERALFKMRQRLRFDVGLRKPRAAKERWAAVAAGN